MYVVGYRVLNTKDEPWAGMEPQPFAVAKEQLEQARKHCPKSWRLVAVSSAPATPDKQRDLS